MKKLEKMKYLQRGYWNSNRKAAVSWQCPAVMGQIVNRDKECERTVTFFRKNCSKYIKKIRGKDYIRQQVLDRSERQESDLGFSYGTQENV